MSDEDISNKIEIDSEPPKNSKPDYILNRESWFKIILISVAAIVIGYKIIEAPINFDFSDFRFSDFLSL
ncbi:hypothetical protein CK503_15830, partial [Aliifodinibius salipaludis]